MEGRVVWSESETLQGEKASSGITEATARSKTTIPQSLPPATKPKPSIKIAIPVDFDAVSGWLGTGASPENNLSEYSSAYFSAYVGVPRPLKLFIKLGIADKITWFVPMHFAESFSEQFKAILDSRCELGLHGYCHKVGYSFLYAKERGVEMNRETEPQQPSNDPTRALPS